MILRKIHYHSTMFRTQKQEIEHYISSFCQNDFFCVESFGENQIPLKTGGQTGGKRV